MVVVVGSIVYASGMGYVRKNLKLTNEEHTNRCRLIHGALVMQCNPLQSEVLGRGEDVCCSCMYVRVCMKLRISVHILHT